MKERKRERRERRGEKRLNRPFHIKGGDIVSLPHPCGRYKSARFLITENECAEIMCLEREIKVGSWFVDEVFGIDHVEH